MSAPRDGLDTTDLLAGSALVLVAGTGAALWLVSGLGMLVTGHGWHPVRSHDVPTVVARVPSHLPDLAAAYPDDLRRQLPPSPVLWLLLATVVILLAVAAIYLIKGVRLIATGEATRHADLRRRQGMASRADIRQHLSAGTARARATHARPSAASGRRDTSQVGLRLGTDLRHRQPIWGSVEDSYLYLGPPRSGKGVHLVIPQCLDAAGALIVTSTRPDVLHATQAHRATRGPVLVFDPQSLAPDVPRLRWNPTRGCTDPLTAINRARALAAGAGLTNSRDGDYWQNMSAAVLRGYLHAAALENKPIGEVLAWAARPGDPTPVRILRNHPDAAPGWAEELAAQAGADPRQRDSVWSGVRRAVDCLADPRVVDACSPKPGEGFDPTTFLTNHASLYLLGATGVQLSVAPLITALLEDLLDTARARAATSVAGRLDPPLLLMLDEAANVAPIPTLPNLLADGGGVGITTVVVLQSLAQARARWGEAAADGMLDAATTKVVLGGLAHTEDLNRIGRLAGDIDVPLETRSHGAGGASRSVSTQRLAVLPIEKVRCLPAGRALVLARRCPPVEVQLRPYWQHPAHQNDREQRRRFRGWVSRLRCLFARNADAPSEAITKPATNTDAATEGTTPCSFP
jgi:type IV secretory pathway TraG/TraD family ATPase VirD4